MTGEYQAAVTESSIQSPETIATNASQWEVCPPGTLAKLKAAEDELAERDKAFTTWMKVAEDRAMKAEQERDQLRDALRHSRIAWASVKHISRDSVALDELIDREWQLCQAALSPILPRRTS